jgi:hypothetical protein
MEKENREKPDEHSKNLDKAKLAKILICKLTQIVKVNSNFKAFLDRSISKAGAEGKGTEKIISKLSDVKHMMEEGSDITLIAKLTGLPKTEILQLRNIFDC